MLLLLVLSLYQLPKVVSSTDLLVLVARKVAICFIGAAAILAYAILVAKEAFGKHHCSTLSFVNPKLCLQFTYCYLTIGF